MDLTLNNFDKALKDAMDAVIFKSKQRTTYTALLGTGDGSTILPTNPNGSRRPNYVWARINLTSGVSIEQIRNTRVPNTYGIEVQVAKSIADDVYEVIDFQPTQADAYYGGTTIAQVGEHAQSHGYWANDPIFPDTRQLPPLRTGLLQTPGLSVHVEPYRQWAGGDIDLTSFVPSGANEQKLVIVCWNQSTNALAIEEGVAKTVNLSSTKYNPFTRDEVLDIEIAVELTTSMVVRLYKDQTRLDIWDLVYDWRQWFGAETIDIVTGYLIDDLGNNLIDDLGNLLIGST